MIMVVFGLPLKMTINIRSFHFTASAKVFSDLESINMPSPPAVFHHAEVIINVNCSRFLYLIFSSWQIMWSTFPKMFTFCHSVLNDTLTSDFVVVMAGALTLVLFGYDLMSWFSVAVKAVVATSTAIVLIFIRDCLLIIFN